MSESGIDRDSGFNVVTVDRLALRCYMMTDFDALLAELNMSRYRPGNAFNIVQAVQRGRLNDDSLFVTFDGEPAARYGQSTVPPFIGDVWFDDIRLRKMLGSSAYLTKVFVPYLRARWAFRLKHAIKSMLDHVAEDTWTVAKPQTTAEVVASKKFNAREPASSHDVIVSKVLLKDPLQVLQISKFLHTVMQDPMAYLTIKPSDEPEVPQDNRRIKWPS